VRALVLIVALAAVAFAAVEERAARRADALSQLALELHGQPRAELAHARALRDSARHVSPDTAPALDYAVLLGRAGNLRAAGAQAQRVTREEPENIRAWAVLSVAARGYDSDLAATARARVLALAPPVPPAR
jgi:Flp pilus assembly protein TadD